MAECISKTCVRCKQQQPMAAFHSAKNRPDGRYPYCRTCCKAVRAERAQNDPQGERERKRHKREYDQRYYAENGERRRGAVKARYQAKAEVVKGYVREWQQANPEKVRAYKASNKAARRSVQSSGMSGGDLLAWKRSQPKVCYWCGKRCARKYHVDHYTPLKKGGRHEAANLVIACPPCNLRKHAKDPIDFAREVGRLL